MHTKTFQRWSIPPCRKEVGEYEVNKHSPETAVILFPSLHGICSSPYQLYLSTAIINVNQWKRTTSHFKTPFLLNVDILLFPDHFSEEFSTHFFFFSQLLLCYLPLILQIGVFSIQTTCQSTIFYNLFPLLPWTSKSSCSLPQISMMLFLFTMF